MLYEQARSALQVDDVAQADVAVAEGFPNRFCSMMTARRGGRKENEKYLFYLIYLPHLFRPDITCIQTSRGSKAKGNRGRQQRQHSWAARQERRDRSLLPR